MGRKAGGKNFGNIVDEPEKVVEVTQFEKSALMEIFTCIQKDFITIKDLEESSGLSYDTCAKIMRGIKSISDTFRISGCVHRTDYFMYLSRKFAIAQPIATAGAQS